MTPEQSDLIAKACDQLALAEESLHTAKSLLHQLAEELYDDFNERPKAWQQTQEGKDVFEYIEYLQTCLDLPIFEVETTDIQDGP